MVLWNTLILVIINRSSPCQQNARPVLMGKKWVYEVQYDEGNGEFVGGGGECTLNGDGTKLDNNGILWNITDVQQNGDTVRILMETNGKDNRKKATLRQTFDVTSKTFSITEEVKYLDQTNYFVRNKHLFRKKK
jgi:hypothetical protein